MELQKALQEVGLSKNEATVYLSLLTAGQVTAGPIVRDTKLHRQIVYQALDRLKEMGLVTILVIRGRQHFQTASPRNLQTILDRKREIVKSLVPELLAQQTKSADAVEARVLHGTKAFFDNLQDIVDSATRTDHLMRIIGGAKDSDFYRVIGDQYNDYVNLLKRTRVKKHLIAPENFSKEFKEKFAKETGNLLRTLATGLTSPTYTRITPEMISIEIYAEEPTIIQIYNKATARGYLEHFNLLWAQSKPYHPSKTAKKSSRL
ncbi:MAG: helix-turn-helix domain-containing protein [Candidatus Uhrbacteria bacterium]